MVKNILFKFMAAGMMLSVLLCGCGKEGRGDIILIGTASAGTEESAASLAGTAQNPDSDSGRVVTGTPGASGLSAASEAPGMQEPSMIRVYVCGAVACPGVVEIPIGSRVEDALLAAGGFSPDALTEAVNLADWADDGQMLYFPTVEEAAAWEPVRSGRDVLEEQNGLININTAGAALLCTLPGIGEARAADIISYREAHGGFASCEDIMKVSGIKKSIYEKICDKITVK